MICGYARVSGKSQDLAAQLADLEAARCERIVAIAPAIDRLWRDTTDLLVIARDLQKV